MDIGRQIRIARRARLMTIEDLAKKIDYTESWISQVETGKKRPGRKMVAAIEAAFLIIFEEDGEDDQA